MIRKQLGILLQDIILFFRVVLMFHFRKKLGPDSI